MKVRNLTPHEVNVVDDCGNAVATFPSEGVARAAQNDVVVGALEVEGGSVPVVKTEFGDPQDLPEPEEGVQLIVSFITVSAAKAAGRTTADLLTTSQPVRDDQGRIVGCRAFAQQ